MNPLIPFLVTVTTLWPWLATGAAGSPDPRHFAPFVWKSEPPADCPFPQSRDLTGIEFLGVHSDYRFADTWYPSWAADGNLYSPWTDGQVHGEGSSSDAIVPDTNSFGGFRLVRGKATTGQAVMIGDDPLKFTVKSLGKVQADPHPYGGRYPCGSLVYRGVWYYGTYCLSPAGSTKFGDMVYNWPWLGPLVGFRISRDFGKTWEETPHTPAQPLFGQTGQWGHPVKIGSPHFVDFGKDMDHSPVAATSLKNVQSSALVTSLPGARARYFLAKMATGQCPGPGSTACGSSVNDWSKTMTRLRAAISDLFIP